MALKSFRKFDFPKILSKAMEFLLLLLLLCLPFYIVVVVALAAAVVIKWRHQHASYCTQFRSACYFTVSLQDVNKMLVAPWMES